MMSRSTRIILLLVIDVFFFFTELIVGAYFVYRASPGAQLKIPLPGYAVGSLALVADSFHMLK